MKILNKKRVLIVLGVVITAGCLSLPEVAGAGVAEFITSALGWVGNILISILGTALLALIDIVIKVFSYNDFISSEAVTIGWVIVRDITNMFFVVVLLIIAFATILKIESYSYQRLLVKLILAVVWVNFSKMITGLFIDLGQVVMMTFVNAFKDIAAGNLTYGFGIEDMVKLRKQGPGQMADIDNWDVLGSIILAVIFLAVACVVILVMIVFLLVRIIYLWVLAIFSPLAFLLPMVPGGKKYADKWWGELGKYIVLGPVLAFFLWLTFTLTAKSGENERRAVIELERSQITNQAAANQTWFASEISGTQNMFNFMVTTALLIMALGFAQEVGGLAGKFAGGAQAKLGKWGTEALKRGTGYKFAKERWDVHRGMKESERKAKVQAAGARLHGAIGKAKEVAGKPLAAVSKYTNIKTAFNKRAKTLREKAKEQRDEGNVQEATRLERNARRWEIGGKFAGQAQNAAMIAAAPVTGGITLAGFVPKIGDRMVKTGREEAVAAKYWKARAVKESSKEMESEETAELHKVAKDLTESPFARIGAMQQLMSRGAYESDQEAMAARSTIVSLSGNDKTIMSTTDNILKKKYGGATPELDRLAKGEVDRNEFVDNMAADIYRKERSTKMSTSTLKAEGGVMTLAALKGASDKDWEEDIEKDADNSKVAKEIINTGDPHKQGGYFNRRGDKKWENKNIEEDDDGKKTFGSTVRMVRNRSLGVGGKFDNVYQVNARGEFVDEDNVELNTLKAGLGKTGSMRNIIKSLDLDAKEDSQDKKNFGDKTEGHYLNQILDSVDPSQFVEMLDSDKTNKKTKNKGLVMLQEVQKRIDSEDISGVKAQQWQAAVAKSLNIGFRARNEKGFYVDPDMYTGTTGPMPGGRPAPGGGGRRRGEEREAPRGEGEEEGMYLRSITDRVKRTQDTEKDFNHKNKGKNLNFYESEKYKKGLKSGDFATREEVKQAEYQQQWHKGQRMKGEEMPGTSIKRFALNKSRSVAMPFDELGVPELEGKDDVYLSKNMSKAKRKQIARGMKAKVDKKITQLKTKKASRGLSKQEEKDLYLYEEVALPKLENDENLVGLKLINSNQKSVGARRSLEHLNNHELIEQSGEKGQEAISDIMNNLEDYLELEEGQTKEDFIKEVKVDLALPEDTPDKNVIEEFFINKVKTKMAMPENTPKKVVFEEMLTEMLTNVGPQADRSRTALKNEKMVKYFEQKTGRKVKRKDEPEEKRELSVEEREVLRQVGEETGTDLTSIPTKPDKMGQSDIKVVKDVTPEVDRVVRGEPKPIQAEQEPADIIETATMGDIDRTAAGGQTQQEETHDRYYKSELKQKPQEVKIVTGESEAPGEKIKIVSAAGAPVGETIAKPEIKVTGTRRGSVRSSEQVGGKPEAEEPATEPEPIEEDKPKGSGSGISFTRGKGMFGHRSRGPAPTKRSFTPAFQSDATRKKVDDKNKISKREEFDATTEELVARAEKRFAGEEAEEVQPESIEPVKQAGTGSGSIGFGQRSAKTIGGGWSGDLPTTRRSRSRFKSGGMSTSRKTEEVADEAKKRDAFDQRTQEIIDRREKRLAAGQQSEREVETITGQAAPKKVITGETKLSDEEFEVKKKEIKGEPSEEKLDVKVVGSGVGSGAKRYSSKDEVDEATAVREAKEKNEKDRNYNILTKQPKADVGGTLAVAGADRSRARRKKAESNEVLKRYEERTGYTDVADKPGVVKRAKGVVDKSKTKIKQTTQKVRQVIKDAPVSVLESHPELEKKKIVDEANKRDAFDRRTQEIDDRYEKRREVDQQPKEVEEPKIAFGKAPDVDEILARRKEREREAKQATEMQDLSDQDRQRVAEDTARKTEKAVERFDDRHPQPRGTLPTGQNLTVDESSNVVKGGPADNYDSDTGASKIIKPGTEDDSDDKPKPKIEVVGKYTKAA